MVSAFDTGNHSKNSVFVNFKLIWWLNLWCQISYNIIVFFLLHLKRLVTRLIHHFKFSCLVVHGCIHNYTLLIAYSCHLIKPIPVNRISKKYNVIGIWGNMVHIIQPNHFQHNICNIVLITWGSQMIHFNFYYFPNFSNIFDQSFFGGFWGFFVVVVLITCIGSSVWSSISITDIVPQPKVS